MLIKPKCLPWFLFASDDDGGGGGGNDDSGKGSTEELGFPKDTPVDEMTPEQQLAYWKNDSEKWKSLSKKHEKNRKPKDFDQTLADAQKWREKQDEDLEPDEKAIKQAREEALAEGRSKGRAEVIPNALRAELKARLPHMSYDDLDEFIEDVNIDNYHTDGVLDLERVDRMATKLAPAPNDDDDDDDDKPPAFTLGGVLSNTRVPTKGKGPSMDEIREQTRAKYKKTDK